MFTPTRLPFEQCVCTLSPPQSHLVQQLILCWKSPLFLGNCDYFTQTSQCDLWLVGMIILASHFFFYYLKNKKLWNVTLVGACTKQTYFVTHGQQLCRSELLNGTFNNILVNCAALQALSFLFFFFFFNSGTWFGWCFTLVVQTPPQICFVNVTKKLLSCSESESWCVQDSLQLWILTLVFCWNWFPFLIVCSLTPNCSM